MKITTVQRAGRGVVLVACALALAACNRADAPVFAGYAEAELVYVSAPIGGVVKTVDAVRGAAVQTGDTLFVLDAEPETLQRNEAAARLVQAQAQAANLRKARRPQEIEAVASQLAQAQAALVSSSASLARHRELVNKGFESASRLDDLTAAVDHDSARVKELQAQLALARSPSRSDEIAAAQALVEASRASLAASAWREGQQTQAAPVAGTVFDVHFRPGERVTANAPVVSLLPAPGAALGGLKLRFYVPQDALARIAPGQTVTVHCDGCPAELRAHVSFISPQAEYTPPVIYSNENRSKLVFLVEARPDERTATALKPGQPIDVRLPEPRP